MGNIITVFITLVILNLGLGYLVSNHLYGEDVSHASNVIEVEQISSTGSGTSADTDL